MTTYLLAGGGTAGHVNPLLATADTIREQHPDATVLVLGTAEGLEARLVPQRGYELLTVPKVPFPRRPNAAALGFPGRWRASVTRVSGYLREHKVDVVVGFGGYAAAPAYIAARRAHLPFVIHEANARPGLANRLGARFTPFVGVAFTNTPLPHARFVGMPLRREIVELDPHASRARAKNEFDLDERPTVLVTGGSLGARSINRTVLAAARSLLDAGYQVLHIQGEKSEFEDPQLPGYHLMDYCDRMDLALSVSDFVISRAGAATVSELAALGLPAVYVPYPVGNGEQRFNAADVVAAGGGLLVADAAFTEGWLREHLLPLLRDEPGIEVMAENAASVGVRDGAARFAALVDEAVASRA